jgi:hypothetical protein
VRGGLATAVLEYLGIFSPRNSPSYASDQLMTHDDRSARILLVEDELQLCMTLGHRRRNEGYFAVAAHGGRIGFETALTTAFDLILLDVMLPFLGPICIQQSLPGACPRPAQHGGDLSSPPAKDANGCPKAFKNDPEKAGDLWEGFTC